MRVPNYEDRRFLVTGGAGFIGSHLCETLISQGARVIAVDNLITGKKENLRKLLGDSAFEYLEQDITAGLKLSGGLAGIFHLASPASPVDYAKYPIETLRVGALGADHALALALEKSCPIVMASTSEVYGDPLEHPQKETYWGNVNPIGPRGCYDESKRYQEALSMAYRRVHGVEAHLVRIFNTYGPRMRINDGRVVPNFCMQALKGEPLTVYGNGKQTRSFCYVDDLIDGILKTLGADYSDPINLGNPVEYSILDFAKKIIELTHSSSSIDFRPLPVDDPRLRCPDITRAKEVLKWSPRIPLEEGLSRTIEYFRSCS